MHGVFLVYLPIYNAGTQESQIDNPRRNSRSAVGPPEANEPPLTFLCYLEESVLYTIGLSMALDFKDGRFVSPKLCSDWKEHCENKINLTIKKEKWLASLKRRFHFFSVTIKPY